jgi:hypothetical protein
MWAGARRRWIKGRVVCPTCRPISAKPVSTHARDYHFLAATSFITSISRSRSSMSLSLAFSCSSCRSRFTSIASGPSSQESAGPKVAEQVSIDFLAAVTLVAEIGDFRRFAHPRDLMGFLGLVPSEFSTGESRHRGSITKTGNGHARRVLIEAAWNYRHPARISRLMQKRQEGQSKPVRDIAWRAQLRLGQRYRRLSSRKLHDNRHYLGTTNRADGTATRCADPMRGILEQDK